MTAPRTSQEIEAQIADFKATLPPNLEMPPENDPAARLEWAGWQTHLRELEVELEQAQRLAFIYRNYGPEGAKLFTDMTGQRQAEDMIRIKMDAGHGLPTKKVFVGAGIASARSEKMPTEEAEKAIKSLGCVISAETRFVEQETPLGGGTVRSPFSAGVTSVGKSPFFSESTPDDVDLLKNELSVYLTLRAELDMANYRIEKLEATVAKLCMEICVPESPPENARLFGAKSSESPPLTVAAH